ncbi:ATP-grasp fold amidoligase family protein [Trinickia diaoshuihuensis]|uniref:ATP-grasp fold amidoligase family protein n=1 Tax=Trinickia diaoshuihuensis TaxID=2292265 RepID=UPI000E2300D3|nr:ATP-grasp fold amidoligase family protein [Trinickia diaoshuihuensis]
MTTQADKLTRPTGAVRAGVDALLAFTRNTRDRLVRRAAASGAGELARAVRRRLRCLGPDALFLWINHRRRVGRFPNLRNPVTYNDYILRRCLHPEPHWTTLADKLAVREYAKSKIGEQYLVPLIAVPETFTREVFEALPDAFVMKANHGCGFVEIVRDKSNTSYEALRRLADRWLATNYYCQARERHYRTIKPRLYFETLLLEADGRVPADVKMNMFGNGPDGPIILTGVVADRFGNVRGDVFDANWNRVDLSLGHFPRSATDVPRPENWQEIIDVATRLAEGLGYVRVDLYNIAGHIYFGELTFTPGAGVFAFHPDRIDYEWGALLKRIEQPAN